MGSKQDDVLQEMDFAAMDAGKELAKLDKQAVQLVAGWWRKWYISAGHKRLAWQLMRQK
jgi:hypothetical protein